MSQATLRRTADAVAWAVEAGPLLQFAHEPFGMSERYAAFCSIMRPRGSQQPAQLSDRLTGRELLERHSHKVGAEMLKDIP